MSGGDSKGKGASKAATPANLAIPPFMGNNQALIAQQLAMGFGGLPSQYTSPLFQPMTIPNYAAGAPLVPGTTPDKKTSTLGDGARSPFLSHVASIPSRKAR
jgi:hypothetical protein